MSLKVIDIIENRINKLRAGYIFTSSDFYDLVNEPTMVSRALRQLILSGKICKSAKGRFYKPQQSIFGTLPPSEDWIVQDYLMDGKRIIGYLTGQYAYSKLGLSTQISSTYTIGSNIYRRAIIRNGIKLRFVLQPNTITRDNIPLLQILDSIRFIRKIPACTPKNACAILRAVICKLSIEERRQIVSLAMQYTDYVRAIVGAILNETDTNTDALYRSLNLASTYKIGLDDSDLPNCKKWRIK